MQHPACRVARKDWSDLSGFLEFLTKPSSLLRVFDFLEREVNRLAKNLSHALVGRVSGDALFPCGTPPESPLGISYLSCPLGAEHERRADGRYYPSPRVKSDARAT